MGVGFVQKEAGASVKQQREEESRGHVKWGRGCRGGKHPELPLETFIVKENRNEAGKGTWGH